MANLLLTILDKAGIPQESVGDSTGTASVGALTRPRLVMLCDLVSLVACSM